MTQSHIICMGNAIVDVIARVDDTFLDQHEMAKGAMILVDAERSKTLYGAMPPAVERSGGSAGNTAAAIAGFGGSVRYIGKVYNDQLGQVFAHDIRAAGVTYTTPMAESGPPTATCMVLVTPDAQRTMNTHLGACTSITENDITPEDFKGAGYLYVEGYLWDTPPMKAAVLKAMDVARAAGAKVALSLSDSFCVERFRSEFQDLIAGKVDVLFANEAEITALYKTGSFEGAVTALKPHVRVAALTRGSDGSVIITPTEMVTVAAEPANVVDTTGAGDLYAAGVLFGLAKGYDLQTSGQLGSLAAAEIISHIGARADMDLKTLAYTKLGL